MGDARCAGVAQLVERKPSKLDVAGSSPVSRFTTGSRHGVGRPQRTARTADGTGLEQGVAIGGRQRESLA
jgi:hypothetical protein